MNGKGKFLKGIKDGVPICLGYLSVAFAFGIFSVESGLGILQTLLVSMTNVTSAGQLAAVPIMVSGGTLIELAVAQLVINLRYALMSVSLSQKLGKSVRLLDRFIISFVNTDEVFAVASGQDGLLQRNYLYGLILTPYIGWSAGTLLGAVAGNVLPVAVISALGIAIYGMFVAIVIPPVKKNLKTAYCVLLAIVLSCAFKYVPFLNNIPGGFAIIICAAVASGVFAVFAPIEIEEVSCDEL
ncbi:MAG: AzlC family ABC transporter permease [Oscillospiraceae bacterium]|nr:AzlC family ABC transporter permease [Oscillospiraceae bacterium]